MEELEEGKKKVLISQAKNCPGRFPAKTLADFIVKYVNVSISDFKDHPAVKSGEVEKCLVEAQAQIALNQIKQKPTGTKAQIEEVLKDISAFLESYSGLLNLGKQAEQLYDVLSKKLIGIIAAEEEAEWNMLNKHDFDALVKYHQAHPNSPHRDDVADLAWSIVNK